ncbi:MAG: ROK family protein [Candidatus Omnitrophica bacterium]|nr:ROK family protein [Candidatus Omnitrophota bacterium]
MKYAIGIDVGGTKISIVIGTEKGRILGRRLIPTQIKSNTQKCLKELEENIIQLLRETSLTSRQILGIGLCLPGAVDSRKGIAPISPHLKGWEGLRLRQRLFGRFKKPVYMTNDANAAAVAEKIFGQAQKAENFIYITISTGVGGGIYANGKLLEGVSFVAGEVGHMTIESQGEPWALGEIGCLEAYASGTAIARYVNRELEQGRGTTFLKRLSKNGPLTTKEIGIAAKKKDKLALAAFQRAGEYLGIGIGNLLNILNPEIVILGGGVLKTAPAVFYQSFKLSCRHRSWPEAFRAVRITRTQLGDNVGNLGAMALVFSQQK